MDPDIHEIASFGDSYSRRIRSMHERARATLGFELPLQVFAARLLQAVELARGEAPVGDSTVGALLDALDAEDLYLATAAVNDDPGAREALRRWFGPFLTALGKPSGHEDLERELLEPTTDGVPLEGYLGLGSLKQWILASAAQAAPPPLPPLVDESRGPIDPEARRALEAGPAAALATARPAVRLALALNRLAGLPEDRAAATAGLTKERFARECARLEEAAVRETRAAIAAHGLEPGESASALADAARALGVASAELETLASPLVADCAARALRNTPSASCPDANLLVGAVERLPGIVLDPLYAHMARCWGCLQAGTVLGPRRGPVRRGRRPRSRTALVTGLGAAAATLVFLAAMGALSHRASRGDEVRAASLPEVAAVEPGREATEAATTTTLAGTADTAPAAEPETREPERWDTPAPTREPQALPRTRATPARSDRTVAATPVSTRVSLPPRPEPAPTRPRSGDGPGMPRDEGRHPLPALATHEADDPGDGPGTPEAVGALGTPAPPTLPSAVRAAPSGAGDAEPVLLALRHSGGKGRGAHLVNLAVDRYRLGAERDAIAMLSRALEVEPGIAVAHFDVALLYERTGDHGRALGHWNRVLELTPESEEAALARLRLGQ